MNELQIELPIPPIAIHPNRRMLDRMAFAKVVRKARANATACTLAALGRSESPRWSKVALECRWYFPCVRKRDEDNLTGWIKAYRDGIADAGIFAGPGDEAIVMTTHKCAVDHDNPRLIAVLTPIQEP